MKFFLAESTRTTILNQENASRQVDSCLFEVVMAQINCQSHKLKLKKDQFWHLNISVYERYLKLLEGLN